jgi:peptide/nickel transport system substrate-binding protein
LKNTKIAGAIAVVGAGALVLTGCTAPSGDSGLDEGTSVNVAWNQPFYSYNSNTSFGNATANAIIIYMTNSGFGYYDNEPSWVQDESFGSYELISEDPLVVEYTLADTAKWSDGTPVDAADLLLNWASQSNAFNDPDFDPSEFTDPETGEVTEDLPAEQVFFDGGGTGLDLVTEVPEVSDDNRSITMTYDEPFVDWELTFGTYGQVLPAHVVANYALDIEDADEAKAAIVDAITERDTAALAPISNAWNTIFNFNEMPEDESLVLSTGPYVITDLVADQYVTLTANENYEGALTPSIEEVTVRFIGDALEAVTALENGEVDVISPQATTDVVTALGELDGVETLLGTEGTYEHIDLQFDQSRSGVFNDPLVREAFLKTVPRQRIVDTLIEPIVGEAAELRSSQVFVPGAEGYDDSVAANGSDAYAETDIEGAIDLLAQAGVSSPEVCVLYDTNNTRRVNEFALVQESAAEAGFNVTDCGTPEWGGLLGTPGAYDASIFGWQSTGLGVTELRANYYRGGINNLNFYGSDAVEALLDELNTEFDTEEQNRILAEIDAELWADAYGATLYQFPSVTGVSDSVSGVDPSVIAPTIFWNIWDWELNN